MPKSPRSKTPPPPKAIPPALAASVRASQQMNAIPPALAGGGGSPFRPPAVAPQPPLMTPGTGRPQLPAMRPGGMSAPGGMGAPGGVGGGQIDPRAALLLAAALRARTGGQGGIGGGRPMPGGMPSRAMGGGVNPQLARDVQAARQFRQTSRNLEQLAPHLAEPGPRGSMARKFMAQAEAHPIGREIATHALENHGARRAAAQPQPRQGGGRPTPGRPQPPRGR